MGQNGNTNYEYLEALDLAEQEGRLQKAIAARHGIDLETMPTSTFYRNEKDRKKTALQKRRIKNRYLESCNKTLTPLCPCNLHHGIQFTDPLTDEVVEKNMCPERWWRRLVSMEIEKGTAEKFVKDTPLGEYLKRYKL